MIPTSYNKYFNRYYGQQWIEAQLPTEPQIWLTGPYELSVKNDTKMITNMACEMTAHLDNDSWVWPEKTIYFFSDLHADTDAFIASLVASGGFKKTGAKDKHFKLTAEGKKARFILGGDCFDKGPSTLRLLRMIKILIDKGADVVILAGNHDTRTLIGILSLSIKKELSTEHLFVRMGLKPLPLFKEIYNSYIRDKKKKKMNTKKCTQKLFPSKEWGIQFPHIAQQQLSPAAIKKDIKKITEKIKKYNGWCAAEGLSLAQVCLAVKKWQKLFLHPKGEFYWFFKHLKLAEKEGSFFFVHAGVDDLGAKMIRKHGTKWLNKQFRKKLKTDLFDLYYGPLGNMIRTKYRNYERHFSKKGTLIMHNAGINVIVHGHRNLYHGQRMMLRKGMINFECDTSLDINTRKKEGVVQGKGASVTIIHPDKLILGISSDYPYIKVFEPELSLKLCHL